MQAGAGCCDSSNHDRDAEGQSRAPHASSTQMPTYAEGTDHVRGVDAGRPIAFLLVPDRDHDQAASAVRQEAHGRRTADAALRDAWCLLGTTPVHERDVLLF